MKLFWKSLFSLLVALLLFEGMVTAFHLLNLPSNLAVFAGMGLLLCLAAGGIVLLRVIWRRKNRDWTKSLKKKSQGRVI